MKRFALAALAAAPAFAWAQDPTPLDPIVVTATGAETRLSALSTNMLVITREDIERAQAFDIADLLQFYAGLEIERSGGPGQLAFVRIRGGETDHTLILIDGVRANPATGAPALERLSPAMIERIEIIKGPRSTLYGSDAVAGVINIVTRQGTSSSADLRLRAGTHATREGVADLRYADTDKRFALGIGQIRSDGIPVCSDGGMPRGFDRTSVNFNGSLTRGETLFSLRAYDNRGNTEYVDFCGPFGNNPLDQDFKQQMLAVELDTHPLPSWRLRTTISRLKDDLQQNQSDDYIRTMRPQIELDNQIELPAGTLGLRASAAEEDASVLIFGTPIEENRELYALRLQYQLALTRQRLLLAAAWDDHDNFGSKTTWTAEYGLDLWRGGELLAAAGTGFRAPNVFERFTGFGGNPDLKPESSRNVELGLRQRLGAYQLVDVRLFRTDTDDLIAFIGGQNRNVPSYRNEGVDLSYRLELEPWSLTLTGLWQDPVNRDTGQALQRRARRTAGLKLARQFGAHSAGIDVGASSSRPDTDFSTFPASTVTVGGYALVGAHAKLRLSPQWQLRARLDNLLDKQYQTVYGYRQDGAAGYLMLQFTY
ncbi:vitamin B12 transporter [Fontimonas thermophila]|uniref:Vitamin B12 transporter n=1 Tax=Fontimonas thermophila TaxID=1076937 RepID=A0A1I2J9I1_9GAMM|nr:TonB-dependent receptor [Fontimonas thermophila]SFF51435.1 vitamin B12 transporter [Fontimonas thermophila]